jgi:hypothetical protein
VRNLKAASDLFDFVLQVKCHRLGLVHPDFTPAQLRAEALRLIDAASR